MADVVSKSQALASFIGGYLPSSSSSKASSSVGLSFNSAVVFESLVSSSGCGFNGGKVGVGEERGRAGLGAMQAVSGQKSLSIGKAMRWWEKGAHDNMVEVGSAQELVDSLLNADNKLVVVDFFSPGCGGCRALHPKICQFAEMNPEVLFLQVNYEEHKSMCYSLNVHVLPFFRYYRGAHGRLCSFSCTNATIKKFKDAMAKHIAERCSLGPAKGLEESELLALASNKDLCFKFTKPLEPLPARGALIEEQMLPPKTPTKASSPGEKGLVTAL